MMRLITILSTVILAMASMSAWAVPTLQTYIDGATYDTGEESWITGSSSFTLSALATNEGSGSGTGASSLNDSSELFLSIALSGAPSLGSSVTINGTTLLDSAYIFGTPPAPIGETDTKDSRKHGVYDAYFTEFSFLLGSACTACVEEKVSGSTMKDGWVHDFTVDIVGYDDVHFDLYTKTLNKKGETVWDHFAPFSHDSEFVRSASTSVPEPVSIALMGLGLLSLGFFNRRKRAE